MIATSSLRSARHEVADEIDAIELFYARGWTDGLPVAPPTPEKVARFLEAGACEPQEILGRVVERGRKVTAEKVAINAVMAGCLPEYAPVVFAAVEALCDAAFNVHGSMASTAGAAPLVMVSGPVVEELGFHAGVNVFGPGNRANATVGRTMRLVLRNVLAAEPGVFDKATLGHPGKYSYCIGEQLTGWDPLHVTRGARDAVNGVTVMAGESPHQTSNHGSNEPESLVATIADTLSHCSMTVGKYAVVICPEHRTVFERAGWSKPDIARALVERAGRSVAALKRSARIGGSIAPGDEAKIVSPIRAEDDVLIVAAGGEAGGFSAVIPPWVGGPSSQPVTRPIRGI